MTQHRYPAAFIRGGTSNAIVFHIRDLPQDRAAWAPLFSAIMGSPDSNMRQLDGMGGGVSSLSKVCIIGPSTRQDADVDYTFAQVSVKDNTVDFSGNCGNMSSAIGPFAIDENIVPAPLNGMTTVRIHNTNTGKVIVSEFEVCDGLARVTGDAKIPGIDSTGAPINLSFEDPAGTNGKGLLPDGTPKSELRTAGGITVSATMIDAAMPCVFVDKSQIGGDTTQHPDLIGSNTVLMAQLEDLRIAASQRMGLTSNPEAAAARIASPKIALIGPAADYQDLSGRHISADEQDIQIRMISAGQVHRAVPVTGALALACAAATQGTIVADMLSANTDPLAIRIGTPSGVVSVGAIHDGTTIKAARILRTQRRLMDGYVYASSDYLDARPDTNSSN